MEQAAELRALVNSPDVPAVVASRARIVLWSSAGRRRKDIAELAGVSLPTVDRWKARYVEFGLAGLESRLPGAPREQVPARVRSRVIALTRMSPPPDNGLSHWSSRTLSAYLRRREGISVSCALHHADLARGETPAASQRHLQDFQGSRVRGEIRRHGRPLP